LARTVAEEIRRVRTEHPYATRTHIFLSGPLGLAVLIGQQLNGLGQVQTYEHIQGEPTRRVRVIHHPNATARQAELALLFGTILHYIGRRAARRWSSAKTKKPPKSLANRALGGFFESG